MPKHYVSVSQLCGERVGKDSYAFLNVEEDAFGGIGVWGSFYKKPTYLFKRGISFCLIQFANQECADEWLSEHLQDYELIWKADGSRFLV